MKQTICICGGGSLGHVMAGILAMHDDCVVNVLTQRPSLWNDKITVQDCEDSVFSGKIDKISSDPEVVIPQSDIVLLCLPGYLIEECLMSIEPFITDNCKIGSIVSSTGFFFIANKILKGKTLFGFQRVPFIARVSEYGYSAKILGYKKQLYIATENMLDKDKEAFLQQLQSWLMTPVSFLNNYLEVSLTNSNPILHTARLYGMWHNWTVDTVYKGNTMFYAEWDNFSSEILINCDVEFQKVLAELSIDASVIPPILEYYECSNAESLTQKIHSIKAFKSIKAPMKKINDNFIPNIEDRYFTEDFPFGLDIVKQLANQYNVEIPTIDKILNWAKNKMNVVVRKIDIL